MGDWCETFFSRMRSNVQEFNNIMNNVGNPSDLLGESGNSGGDDFNAIIFGGMLFVFIVYMLYSAEQALPQPPECGPSNRNNDRHDDDIHSLD